MAKKTRDETYPHARGWSRMTSGFLPHFRASATIVSMVVGDASGCTTISARGITGAGDAQCHTITRSGLSVAAAMGATGKPELLVARIALMGASLSIHLKVSILVGKFSGTASIMRSASSHTTARSVVVDNLASAPSASLEDTLPISTALLRP